MCVTHRHETYVYLYDIDVLLSTKQVAQAQYMVSDTRCPALSDCDLSEGKQGSGPEGDKVL